MKLKCTKKNYIERLQNLYDSSEYFVRLDQSNKRADYWDISIDPDGVKRDIFQEFELWSSNNSELVELCFELINLTDKNDKILDYGSGPGYLFKNLLRLGLKDRNLYAFDKSDLAQASLVELGVNLIKDENQIKNNKFSLVIANHVIEHLENPTEVFRALVDALTPGGTIIIGTPDFLSPSALLFRERYRMLNEPTHIALFSQDSLLRMMRHYKLSVKSVTYPFWQSPYFDMSTFEKAFNHRTQTASPPFPGNFLLAVGTKSTKE